MHVSLRDSPEQLVVKHFVNAFGPDSLIKAQAFKTRTAKAFPFPANRWAALQRLMYLSSQDQ